ncbi:DUF3313 family protein [Iodidimonas sp. SYSU 1G8]|uniref:DUF3313 family protein n=1 Tax=Iodidimonas sp. SYSU 1G8 TaxID=3133967 RepID=UPI0031FE7BFC
MNHTAFASLSLRLRAVCLIPALFLAAPVAAQPADPIVSDAVASGLQPVGDRQLDVVFAAPGVNLGAYRAVMLEPITVNYLRDDKRMYRLSRADMTKLQALATSVLETQLAGRYSVVTEPGEGVLAIRAALANVWLAFPKGAEAGGQPTLAEYAVRMSLEAELIDSVSNQVLMVVADRQGGRVHEASAPVTSDDAWSEVEKAIAFWAGALRKRLDSAEPADTK